MKVEGDGFREISLIWEILVQTRLIKTGGRLVRHAKRLVFQFRLRRESSMKSGLAEVLVTKEMLTEIWNGSAGFGQHQGSLHREIWYGCRYYWVVQGKWTTPRE